MIRNRHNSSRSNFPLNIGLSIGLVSVATASSLVMRGSFADPTWLLFPAAVVAATWFYGRVAGWLAVVLSMLAVQYFFIPPLGSLRVTSRDIPFFLTFIACVTAANRLVAWRRRVDYALIRARDELELRVMERTAELESAHGALVRQAEEQKQTEEALQVARADLARVARITMIGELTAAISHEVNQPIAAIVANADACVAWLALSEPDLSEARAAALRAVQGATRASEVISRIRSLIRKGSSKREEVQLNGVIEETIALIEGQASRNDVTIVVALKSNLPCVLGDKVQLQQVTINLMVNAIEAMTASEGRERLLSIRSESYNEQLCISIEDTGTGISPETMARLFEPFFTTREQGIGMGLAISRSIIESHGGRLWAESVLGQGTAFEFLLPVSNEVDFEAVRETA